MNMDQPTTTYTQQLHQLNAYLYARRESILNRWRTRCTAESSVSTRNGFSREEFNDHMPALLTILLECLVGAPLDSDPMEQASLHGLQRWQRSYSLAELMAELASFYAVLDDELRDYLDRFPETQPTVMAHAYRQVLRLSQAIGQGSLLSFDQLHQTSAAERVQTLEESLNQLETLTRQRGQQLRQTSHDLRGSFGIISGTAQLLQLPAGDDERNQFVESLNRNIQGALHLLNQLLDYARLEAVQETLDNQPFDAAELLRSLVAGAQGIAQHKGLTLKADGPAPMRVVGDALKVQRLVQNLLVNSIRHTQSGWVNVSWVMENDSRWSISVQDTGPGLSSGPQALLAGQLQPTAQQTSALWSETPGQPPARIVPPLVRQFTKSAQYQSDGEGIGLFIIKGLCDLMKGSMDVETSEQGTLIRIRLLVNPNLTDQGSA